MFAEKKEISTPLTNGQQNRLLKRFGSGQGRYWPSYALGTAISDNRGWYRPTKRTR